MKKRKRVIMISLLLIFAITVMLWDVGVKIFIQVNHQSLETFAVKSLEIASSEYEQLRYGIWDASCWKNANVVEFYTGNIGIAPSSHVKGFYYSADDIPIAFNAADTPLIADESGWHWEKLGNKGKTERIIPHWFWYEVNF